MVKYSRIIILGEKTDLEDCFDTELVIHCKNNDEVFSNVLPTQKNLVVISSYSKKLTEVFLIKVSEKLLFSSLDVYVLLSESDARDLLQSYMSLGAIPVTSIKEILP